MEKVQIQRLPLVIKKILIENNALFSIFFHIRKMCKICKIHDFPIDILLQTCGIISSDSFIRC